MSHWIRFTENTKESFGILYGNDITVYEGNIFNDPIKSTIKLKLEYVTIINPCKPSKMIAL